MRRMASVTGKRRNEHTHTHTASRDYSSVCLLSNEMSTCDNACEQNVGNKRIGETEIVNN